MEQVRYTQGIIGRDNLVAQRRGGVDSFYAFDLVGNTRQLVDINGGVLVTYTYESLGPERYVVGSSPNTACFGGQSGYIRDAADRYDLRRRPLAPKTGQWLSRDPIGFRGGGANLLTYVGNDPVSGVDPLGLRQLNADDNALLRRLLDWAISHNGKGPGQVGLLHAANGAILAIKAAIAAVPEGTADPVNLQVALNAIRNLGSSAYGNSVEVPSNGMTSAIPAGKPKCNIFVADAYGIGGGIGYGGTGVPTTSTWRGNVYPRVANDLGNSALTIPNFPVTHSPKVGDIAAFHSPGGIGHSGINLGGGLLIYASNPGVILGTVAGARNTEGGVYPTYRTYR